MDLSCPQSDRYWRIVWRGGVRRESSRPVSGNGLEGDVCSVRTLSIVWQRKFASWEYAIAV